MQWRGQDGGASGRACLYPLLFSQLARHLASRERHFYINWLLNYLFVTASSLRAVVAAAGGVTECLTQLGKTNPIEFFGDRSCPAHSIRHHLPLSDRLIGTGRMYHRSRRSVSALLCSWWPRGGARASTHGWHALPAAAHNWNWVTHTA